MFKTNNLKSSGKSALFLILGAVIIIIVALVVVAYLRTSSRDSENSEPVEIVKGEMPELVHEVVIGDIKFTLVEAKDIGNILRCQERTVLPTRCRPQDDLVTTDKFIKVTITAQNIGKDDIRRGNWSVEELVDSDGRKFYSARAGRWIPEESECAALLKPSFTPTSCTEIYDVAKHSIGLKLRVFAYANPEKRTGPSKESFIDLGLYDEKYCWEDSDCACGINKYTNDCFSGNKTYVADPDPLIYPQELIEECNRFCAINAEEPQIKCIDNRCRF